VDEVRQLIYRGAEANIYLTQWHGYNVIKKERVAKKYRVGLLDEELRRRRTVHEAQLLYDAKRNGVPAPTVLLLSPKDSTLLLSRIDGERLREKLARVDKGEAVGLCLEVGRLVARLHRAGIQHGDLTTSNMVQTADGRIFLVDFGLGAYSTQVEDMGVDILLMKRALTSTHYRISEECFQSFLKGYRLELGEEKADTVFERVKAIERRGRYVERRVSK